MIKLNISKWTHEGETFMTYTLEGNTYPVKEDIKQLGFHWDIPADVVNVLGTEASKNPMFTRNKKWSVTYSGEQDRTEWIDNVCNTLDAQVEYSDNNVNDNSVNVNGYRVEINSSKVTIDKKVTGYIKSNTHVELDYYDDVVAKALHLNGKYIEELYGKWKEVTKLVVSAILCDDKGFTIEESEEIGKLVSENDKFVENVKDYLEVEWEDSK